MSDWGARQQFGERGRGVDGPLAESVPDDEERWRRESDDCQVPRDRLAQLVHIIESETIPRLVLAHRKAAAEAERDSDDAPPIDAEAVRHLAGLVLSPDQRPALDYVRGLYAQGVRREALFLDLLAPTAKYLGQLWEQDFCDFTEVTVGLCRLHQVVREMSPGFERSTEDGQVRRALLAPVPGEQHTFGLLMVTEFFRRDGWDVWGGPSARDQDVLQIVGAEWFSVVGFSVSCDDRLEELTRWIEAIRSASRNPGIGVLVGGRVFVDRPELVGQVGADATALDGREAPHRAVRLPSELRRH